MRILGLTSLYPNPYQPHRAVFNRHLYRLLAEHHAVQLIAPIAWTDELRARCRIASALSPSRRRMNDGIEVEHPRYYFPPRILRGSYGQCFEMSVTDAFRRAVSEFHPAVVHAAFAYPDGWAAVRLAHAAGLPVVIQVHGSDVRLLDQYPARRKRSIEALCAADAVIAVSQDLATTIVRMGADPERVNVVYEGIDPTLFIADSKPKARAKLGLDEAPQLLFVGRLDPVKGLNVLLDACAILHRDQRKYTLHLIGDGPLRMALTRQARRLAIADCVRFHGVVEQHKLADWYNAADLVVLSSYSEGVPNVLLEAMACHTRFVASDVGGIPEIAQPGLCRLVPPDNAAALAAAIRWGVETRPPSESAWPEPKLRTDTVAEIAEILETATLVPARSRPTFEVTQ